MCVLPFKILNLNGGALMLEVNGSFLCLGLFLNALLDGFSNFLFHILNDLYLFDSPHV